MPTPPPAMLALARRLLTVSGTAAAPAVHEAAVLIETLRAPLTRLVGAEGFRSLLRRALVLACAEEPSLRSLQVGPDGRLEEMEAPAPEGGPTPAPNDAAVTLAAQLLGLLDTFIGERLTLRLVGQAWPEVSPNADRSEHEADE